VKGIVLFSSGIDSPVAAYLMAKQGMEIIAVSMDNRPFTEERQREKMRKLVAQVEKASNAEIKHYFVPHGPNLQKFADCCDSHYRCVLCKRMMLRIADKIAEMENADFIITGDSLGQVASQTIKNLRAESAVPHREILRPLIGFDKEEIIEIARKIGTFEISSIQDGGCKAVPEMPKTHAKIGEIEKEEEKVDISAFASSSVEDSTVDK
jgi:thiamine biosynthesis protein ThiI